MATASDILDKLGRKRVAATIGVGGTAVSNAASANLFPASWYIAISHMCEAEGIDCPPYLFPMKGNFSPSVPKSGDAA